MEQVSLYKNSIKRLIDLAVSFLVFIVFLPILLAISIVLFILNNGKPFFVQVRPGKRGKLFKIIKFKTMNDKVGPDGELLPDAERLTAFGSFVRKTSLDELPQIINVLKGDMSLVGPRPLLPQYLPLYSAEQSRRHEVKPGITGWAQVNGRNAISWKQKFELDIYYVDHYSLALDLKILLYTIIKVFKRDGVNASTLITMEAFNGEN